MKKNKEAKIVFLVITILFLLFLALPVIQLLMKSLLDGQGISMSHYREVFTGRGFMGAVGNSFLIASVSALVTTLLAFFLAYTIHYTDIPKIYKKLIRAAALLPMLLPTITYGFAIIYSFGKQGLITRLLGGQLFEIYGFNGLLLGYVIYTLPISFMLIDNTMRFIDKKYLIVSRIMGDRPLSTFWITLVRPLLGTLAASFIQSFFLCFTDFGIPASVGGKFDVIASVLYNEMLGSVPNFNNGAVVAVVMLIPSVVSILALRYLERYNVRYNKISEIENKRNRKRDMLCGGLSGVFLLCILSIFLVIFIIPFVEEWPYNIQFTLKNFQNVLSDKSLSNVYLNSLVVALLTAVFGTLMAYGAALVTARSSVNKRLKEVIESIALVTNTIPGMVLGLAFLFAFSGSSLQSTFLIIILCNMVHFFSTPYLMMKNALAKMNASWETTAKLMGDSWLKTVLRIVTPNAKSTILEVFSYYFVNGMVTISAVIFITGARTMVVTTKIKELQHYAKFNEIFILSLLILITNLIGKGLFKRLAHKKAKEKGERRTMKKWKKAVTCLMAGVLLLSGISMVGCGTKNTQVVIYSNADDEAMKAIKATLDQNGYEGQYIFQSFGTSELGGKLMAEGTKIEADLVTMSSYYLDSAQIQNKMWTDLTFSSNPLAEYPSYYTPVTALEGAMIINTELMKEKNLPVPTSLKDLTDPVYKDLISITDITSSSTAWLLIQALVSAYGEEEAKDILTKIYENAGPHMEDSGSGPLKKVRAGEVAIGFGLRHQIVADKQKGLPVDYIDPTEGSFSLTESVAVIDKGDKTKELAMEMAECMVSKGRTELIKEYPIPLYEGETAGSEGRPENPQIFAEPLTVELLKKHQELSESCKS